MRWLQRGLALATAGLIIVLAVKQWIPFNTDPKPIEDFRRPSVWQYLLSDRYVLGTVRLAIGAFALYIAISVPALVAAARWVKGFGTSGLTADDADKASDTLEDYEQEMATMTSKLDTANTTIGQLRAQRDTALSLLRTVTSPTTTTLRTGAPGVSRPIVGEEGDSGDAERTERKGEGAEPGGEADGQGG
jgi:hypothetical protein